MPLDKSWTSSRFKITNYGFREDSSILFGETSLGHLRHLGGVGVLLLGVSVKLKIIDFLQPRIKQKLQQYIIITPEKCVIGIDYVQS